MTIVNPMSKDLRMYSYLYVCVYIRKSVSHCIGSMARSRCPEGSLVCEVQLSCHKSSHGKFKSNTIRGFSQISVSFIGVLVGKKYLRMFLLRICFFFFGKLCVTTQSEKTKF